MTDGGLDASGSATYAWQVFNGTSWVAANGSVTNAANYTPVEADEGSQLRLVVSLANDPSGTESSTYSLGTVQESAANDLVATLDSATATQGAAIHVTAVTDGGLDASGSATYAWQVFNGTSWVAANGSVTNAANYTPVEADEGSQLRLVVSLANDPSGTESSTYSLGTVQESAANDLVATLDSATATQGAAIHVTAVTDGGLDASGSATYAWQVFNGTSWVAANGSVTNAANYTPVEADEGSQLRLVVSLANDPSGTESSTYSLGTVTVNDAPVVSVAASSPGFTTLDDPALSHTWRSASTMPA